MRDTVQRIHIKKEPETKAKGCAKSGGAFRSGLDSNHRLRNLCNKTQGFAYHPSKPIAFHNLLPDNWHSLSAPKNLGTVYSYEFAMPFSISYMYFRWGQVRTITFLLLSVCPQKDKKTFFKYTTSSNELTHIHVIENHRYKTKQEAVNSTPLLDILQFSCQHFARFVH